MNAISSSHLAPIRANCDCPSAQPSENSEALRIFDRMSASELSLYISRYGVRALPRLTNHTQRVKAAMTFQPRDEPQALAEAVARFQKEFDRIKREERMAVNKGWGNLRPNANPGGPPYTFESYRCACCGESFRPLKSQVSRGNGIYCGKMECRKAAREARKMRTT